MLPQAKRLREDQIEANANYILGIPILKKS